MSAAAGPDIVTNGLVLHLDAGNRKSYSGSGTVWRDLAGNNNGTLTNGPTFSTENLGRLIFNGSNQYASVSHNPILNLTETFTISLWIRSNTNSQSYILNKNNIYAIINGYQSGHVNFYNNAYQPDSTSTRIPITLGEWTYIVYSKNLNSLSNNWNGYKNAINIFSLTRSFTNGTNTDSLNISTSTGNIDMFAGSISTLKIYNRALSASEVLQNYNATKGRFQLT